MKKKYRIGDMCFVAMSALITGCQSIAMESKTSKGLIYSDLIENCTEKGIKYKFCCEEIENIINENNSGARLPTQLEAHEICQALDITYLRGIYQRDDFELAYQNFWISGVSLEQPLIFCPMQEHDETKTPDKGEKCCLRLIIDSNVVRARLVSRVAELGYYAIERISPHCTLQNALLGVAALGVGGSAMYAYKCWHAAAKVGAVVVVVNNVPGLRKGLGNIWQICRQTCGNALTMCWLGLGHLGAR